MNVLPPELKAEANEHAILNTLLYLNEYFHVKNGTALRYLVNKIDTVTLDKKKMRWYHIVKEAVSRNQHLGNLIIRNQSKYMPGFEDTRGLNSCTFTDRKTGYTAVIIRGTASGEWLDNGHGIAGEVTDTRQQEQANDYVSQVMNRLRNRANMISPRRSSPVDTVVISGHSKGGNKAQYITINSEFRSGIKRCFNFDGQGMSPEAAASFQKRYGEASYKTAVEKMYGFYADNDYVNPLGVSVIPRNHEYYFKNSLVHGIWDIEKYHYPDNYLNDNGSFTEQTEQGEFSKYIDDVSNEVETIPPKIRSVIADSVMAVAQGKKASVDGSSVSRGEVLAGLTLTAPLLVSVLSKNEKRKKILNETINEELEKLKESVPKV